MSTPSCVNCLITVAVRVTLGATQLTVIPCGPNSRARDLEKCATAALVPAYADIVGPGTLATALVIVVADYSLPRSIITTPFPITLSGAIPPVKERIFI